MCVCVFFFFVVVVFFVVFSVFFFCKFYISYNNLCGSGFITFTEVTFKRQQVKGSQVSFNFICSRRGTML